MAWNTVIKVLVIAAAASPAGCDSAQKPHMHSTDASMHQHDGMKNDDMKMVAHSGIELVGLTGMDDLIPTRSVNIAALGLSCPLCAHNLDKQLMKIDGVESAQIDLATGTASVALTETGRVTPRQLVDAVKASGFSVTRIEASNLIPMKHEMNMMQDMGMKHEKMEEMSNHEMH